MAPKKTKKTKKTTNIKDTKIAKKPGLDFKEWIDPQKLAELIESDKPVLRMDSKGEDDDRAAYFELIDGVTRSVTGVEVLANNRTGFLDFYSTLSNTKQKVLVIHVLGVFNDDNYNHLLMVIKENIYVVAVKPDDGLWIEAIDSKEYPIIGALSYDFKMGYYAVTGGLASGAIKLGFLELKYALKRLIFGQPTAVDLLTVALNVCEAVRYPFIANRVAELIGEDERRGEDERHGEDGVLGSRKPCARSIFLAGNWGNISNSIEQVQMGKDWKFNYAGNKIDGVPFVTKQSVLELVRVIKKSGKGRNGKGKKK